MKKQHITLVLFVLLFGTLLAQTPNNVEKASRFQVVQEFALQGVADNLGSSDISSVNNDITLMISSEVENLASRYGYIRSNSQLENLGSRYGFTRSNAQIENLGSRYGFTRSNAQIENLGSRYGFTRSNAQIENLGSRYGFTRSNAQIEDLGI